MANKENIKVVANNAKEKASRAKKDKDVLLNGVIAYLEFDEGLKDSKLNAEEVLNRRGAKVRKQITKDITHLIYVSGDKDVYETFKKKGDVKIVSDQWLQRCNVENNRLDEDEFLVERKKPQTKRKTDPEKENLDAKKNNTIVEIEIRNKRQKLGSIASKSKILDEKAAEQKMNSLKENALVNNPAVTLGKKPIATMPQGKNGEKRSANKNSELLAMKESEMVSASSLQKSLGLTIPQKGSKKKDLVAINDKIKKNVAEAIEATSENHLNDKTAKVKHNPNTNKKTKEASKMKKTILKDKKKQNSVDSDDEHESDLNLNDNSEDLTTSSTNDSPIHTNSLDPEFKGNPKAKVSLAITSTSTAMRDIILSTVKMLGDFRIVKQVDESTTHLIIENQRRTINLMLAIAYGTKIVSPEWAMVSLEKGAWVDSTSYEIRDWFAAINKPLGKKGNAVLFKKKRKICIGTTESPRENCMALAKAVGLEICSNDVAVDICLGAFPDKAYLMVPAVSEKWLFDSICQGKELLTDNYLFQDKMHGSIPDSPVY